MAAFQAGFQMGGSLANQAIQNAMAERELAIREAAEKRNAEEQGLRISAARRVNEATDALTNAQTLGLQVPGAQQNNEGLQRQSFRQFEIGQQNAEAAGTEAPAYVAPTGLQQTYRPAGDLDINRLQAALAAAKGDVQGMEALRLGRKGIEFDEGYKKHLEDWNKMDDAARADLIGKLSYDTGVKGFGTWTPGKGKQAGYMTYLPPTGDPVKLSAKEAGDLYALTNLMSVDPMRARAEMDKVSDKVRAVAAQAFDAQSKGVTANNQATRFANADDISRQELGIKSSAAAAQRDYYGALRDKASRPDAANLREFVNDKGEVTLVDITSLPRGRDGTIPLPAGLKPRTAKPSVTPEAYFQALERANTVYGDPAQARMAVDQMFGLTAPTNQIAENLKALNDKKGGARTGAAPAAAPAQTPTLGLPQRLGAAVSTDNTAGNRNQFLALAAEAERNAPAYAQQISVLRNALGSARTPGERANLENRIVELENDLGIYTSILEQRAAQRGY